MIIVIVKLTVEKFNIGCICREKHGTVYSNTITDYSMLVELEISRKTFRITRLFPPPRIKNLLGKFHL